MGRTILVLLCVALFVVATEGEVEEPAKPKHLAHDGSVLPGGTVDDIIPEFQTGDEWAHANEKMRAAYNRANDNFKKLNAKKYAAQGKARKEVNAKANKALVALKEAKESVQKKYAKDDPSDFGEGPMTSADKANAIRDAKQKDISTGRWGSSGVPGDQKWYTNGVISSDAYRDEDGHYLLGPSRRRIGAGFGRRRRFVAANSTVEGAEQGHDILKEGIGKPEPEPEQGEIKDLVKTKVPAEVPTKPVVKLPPGVQIADKTKISPEEEETLKATGAGVDAQVDDTAHFTKATDVKIIGVNATEEIAGDSDLVTPLK